MITRLKQRLLFASLSLGLKGMGRAFLRSTRQAPAIAHQTLRRILEVNGETVFGRLHGLSGPSRLQAFRELPTTTYADYAAYIRDMADGRQGVLSSEPVTYFFYTTGTTAERKLIPVTKRQSRFVIQHMFIPLGLALSSGTLGPLRGRWLHLMMLAPQGITSAGIPLRVSGHMAAEQLGPVLDLVWSSPLSIYRITDQATSLYLHFLAALGEEQLWCIVSQFPSTLLEGFRALHARAPDLLRDLADGTLAKDLVLSASQRAGLSSQLQRRPARARALEALLEQGRFTARDIWPHMGAVLTAGSGVQRFYTGQLMPYLGDVRVFSPVYGAAEGIIGVARQAETLGYIVSPRAAYVEFLPAEETNAAARPLSLEEVEIGRTYEIVLTTYSGLCRYRLGDVVKVLGWHERAPVIDFVERKGQVLNIANEKVTEAQVAESFECACRSVGAALVDYIVTVDSSASPMRYLLLVEQAAASTTRSDAQALLRAFEHELQQTCWYYGELRHHATLGPPGLLLLPGGSFERYRELRTSQGGLPSQVKVPHVVSDPGFASRHFESAPRLELSD